MDARPIGGAVAGKIAFIDRGNCNFTVKVKNAQNAGALAVIIGNVSSSNDPTNPPGMGGSDDTITIPSVSLNLADADTFRAQLGNAIIASILVDVMISPALILRIERRCTRPAPLQAGVISVTL
jgi:hypothetical protein